MCFLAVHGCYGRLAAQEETEYGKILEVSGKTATVQFEQRNIAVGDEVEFWRLQAIIDPVSGVERGNTRRLIARGVVDDIGLGKASITITAQMGSDKVTPADRARLTGTKKQIIRKVARIQEISEDRTEMTIDLGREDEISEGDEFLIQRTENIYDIKTKQVTGTNQVDIGRGRISAVKNQTSTAQITHVEPGKQIEATDSVVFAPAVNASAPVSALPPSETADMRDEIARLRREVTALRATVDSLGSAHLIHRQEFQVLKTEVEKVAAKLMIGDIQGPRIKVRNTETIVINPPDGLLAQYRRALEDCLAHRFEQAVPQFQRVMDENPDSPLVENCRYWIAQSQYSSGDYTSAAAGFQETLDDARFTHKDDDAAIMLGITYFQMGRLKEALDVLHRFTAEYPESEYRDKVRQWIEQISMIQSRG
jgi:TolA-binding protein